MARTMSLCAWTAPPPRLHGIRLLQVYWSAFPHLLYTSDFAKGNSPIGNGSAMGVGYWPAAQAGSLGALLRSRAFNRPAANEPVANAGTPVVRVCSIFPHHRTAASMLRAVSVVWARSSRRDRRRALLRTVEEEIIEERGSAENTAWKKRPNLPTAPMVRIRRVCLNPVPKEP